MNFNHTYELQTTCPYCRKRNPLHDGPGFPEPGDKSLCIGCGQFSVFADRGETVLRKPTLIEEEEIAANPGCIEILRCWRLLKKQEAHQWP